MKLLLLALETGKIGENDVMSLIQTGLERKLFNTNRICSSTRYRFQRGCYSKMSPAMKKNIFVVWTRGNR